MLDGRFRPLPVRFHQIDAREELVGRVHALQALARNAHEPGQARARTDEHRLVAHFEQLVDGDRLANDHVGLDVDAQLLQAVDLLAHDILGQAEFRHAVHQHTARGGQRLVHRHLIAQLCKVTGRRQPGRAGADDRHPVPVGHGHGGLFGAVLPMPVGHKPLQTADAHAFRFDAANTFALALVLLRAHAAAHRRQRAGRAEHGVRLFLQFRQRFASFTAIS